MEPAYAADHHPDKSWVCASLRDRCEKCSYLAKHPANPPDEEGPKQVLDLTSPTCLTQAAS